MSLFRIGKPEGIMCEPTIKWVFVVQAPSLRAVWANLPGIGFATPEETWVVEELEDEISLYLLRKEASDYVVSKGYKVNDIQAEGNY